MSTVADGPAGPAVLGSEDLTPPGCRWLKIKRLQCVDNAGRHYTWEYVERTTKFRETDGVAVFAKVISKSDPSKPPGVVIIAQWRPPVGSFVLELPAGIIEAGETPQEVAARELQEETGFTGTVEFASPELFGEPGLTNNALNLCTAEVDIDLECNQEPQATPEVGEVIHTLVLPLEGLAERLVELKATKGWAIDSRLFALALGLKLGATLS